MRIFLVASLLLVAGTCFSQTNVILYTNMGEIRAEMLEDSVPITAGNFIDLTNQEYYDGVIFHRVIDNFMIQGGDPTGTGSGGPGYTIQDEFLPSLRHDSAGIFSMANAGPNTGGSQFFITLVPTSWLDDAHAIFGRVLEGMDVVNAIGDVATNAQDRPLSDVVMDSVRVVAPVGIADNPAMQQGEAQAYPNPLYFGTTIQLEQPAAQPVQAMIYDMEGRVVRSIRSTSQQLRWDAHTDNGERVAPGIYFCHLSSGDTQAVVRLVVLQH